MPALDNPRHERFAQLVATAKEDGSVRSDTEAYQIAYGCDYDQANANAWRLKGDDGINQRILELKQPISDKFALTKDESLQFLADIVRTPIGKIDEMHPLAQAVKRSPEGNVVEVKMPAKLDALTLNAKLQGWLVERQESSVKLAIYHAGPEQEKPVIDV